MDWKSSLKTNFWSNVFYHLCHEVWIRPLHCDVTRFHCDRWKTRMMYSTRNIIFYNFILSYHVLILSHRAYMLFHRASILSYRSWILSHVFLFKSFCIVCVSYVSCICNSLGSHETFHCLYDKNQVFPKWFSFC